MIYLTQNRLNEVISHPSYKYVFTVFVNSMISSGTIWFILAGVIIIVIAIIFAVKKRKNKKENK